MFVVFGYVVKLVPAPVVPKLTKSVLMRSAVPVVMPSLPVWMVVLPAYVCMMLAVPLPSVKVPDPSFTRLPGPERVAP